MVKMRPGNALIVILFDNKSFIVLALKTTVLV